MARFLYKAKKGLSEVLDGAIEAENKDAALETLTKQGLFPISISEATTDKVSAHTQKARRHRGKITSGEILNFTQKLTTLIRARVDLLASLKILHEQTENTRFKEVIQGLYNTTKEGKPFSESLERFPDQFSLLFVAIVRTGEASGKLDSALEQTNEFMLREENLKNKISVALAYPALLVLVGLASIFVLMNFVIPRLKPIFSGLGQKLPFITQVILNMSAVSNKTWLIFLLSVIPIICYLLYHPKGRFLLKRMMIYLKLNLPIVKRLSRSQELVNLSRTLSLLLKSGVPALKSLDIAIPSLFTLKLKEELTKVCQEVAQGENLSKSMDSYTHLPKFFIKMVAVGEESGRLAEVLEEISRSYTQSLEKDIAIVTSLIEPVLILILGLVLGTIVLSILLPTFQITQMVR